MGWLPLLLVLACQWIGLIRINADEGMIEGTH
jgi:hypothetical protein